LVLYAPQAPELAEAVIKEFNEKYPDVRVEWITGGTGELMARIRAEKDHPRGDVMWGGSTEMHGANADLFEAVILPDTAMFAAHDPKNKWHALTTIPKPLGVNTTLLKPEEYPKTIEELSDPKWKAGRISFVNPRTSGTGYSILTAMVTRYGWDWVADFLRNCVVWAGSSEMFAALRDGEAALGFFNEDIGARWMAEGAPIVLLYPPDGVATEIEAFAMIKGAPHPNAARAFMEFLQSKEIAELIRDTVWRRSMRKDVAPPADLADLDAITFVEVDAEWASKQREENLNKFDEALAKAEAK
jgi:iron(III) transport system substrate-binding protein